MAPPARPEPPAPGHPPRPDRARAGPALGAIRAWLVLGGESLERPTRSALAAWVHGAARGSPPPRLLLSGGGRVAGGRRATTEAEWMAERLLDLGVPAADLLIEPQARDTLGNLVHGAALAARHGLPRPGLITDAFHARRCAWLHRRVHGVPPPALLAAPAPAGWRLRAREPLAAAWLGLRLAAAGVAAGDPAAHAAWLARGPGGARAAERPGPA